MVENVAGKLGLTRKKLQSAKDASSENGDESNSKDVSSENGDETEEKSDDEAPLLH